MKLPNELAELLPTKIQEVIQRGYHTRFDASELLQFAEAVRRKVLQEEGGMKDFIHIQPKWFLVD